MTIHLLRSAGLLRHDNNTVVLCSGLCRCLT